MRNENADGGYPSLRVQKAFRNRIAQAARVVLVFGSVHRWYSKCQNPMPCDCHPQDNVEIQRHTLVLLVVINATMFCFELVAGILATSTALLADSLDMFADAAIYGIALYAVGKAHSAKRRAASPAEFSKAYLD